MGQQWDGRLFTCISGGVLSSQSQLIIWVLCANILVCLIHGDLAITTGVCLLVTHNSLNSYFDPSYYTERKDAPLNTSHHLTPMGTFLARKALTRCVRRRNSSRVAASNIAEQKVWRMPLGNRGCSYKGSRRHDSIAIKIPGFLHPVLGVIV